MTFRTKCVQNRFVKSVKSGKNIGNTRHWQNSANTEPNIRQFCSEKMIIITYQYDDSETE